MSWYAQFDGSRIIAGPQSEDPGGWTEVLLDDVPPGTLTEWDFSGPLPRRKARVLSAAEQLAVEGGKTRSRRNRLLQESDWTDTASAPARLGSTLYDQWQTYRQALRDITSQPGFPFEVVWPAPPGTS